MSDGCHALGFHPSTRMERLVSVSQNPEFMVSVFHQHSFSLFLPGLCEHQKGLSDLLGLRELCSVIEINVWESVPKMKFEGKRKPSRFLS